MYKFHPIFKSVLWGGRRIAEFKGIAPQGDTIGESWELSPMKGHESVISEGPDRGKTLTELIAEKGAEVMGKRLMEKYHGKFPLLIKFIDSQNDLSIQVHPDEELAARRHHGTGKTELWYSVEPEEGAYLYCGFSRDIDADEFRRRVSGHTLVKALRRYETRKGDVFFLPAGRIHSLGKGNFVLEIQQASDITYRIYDYDRADADGNKRELHVEQSVDAVRFGDITSERVKNVLPCPNGHAMLATCRHFHSELLTIDGEVKSDLTKRDSFTVLTCTDGELTLTTDNDRTQLRRGETILIPFSDKTLTIAGTGTLVSTYVP